MGRWSHQVAEHFLDWLALPPGLNRLDVGCGTGVLSHAICKKHRPQNLVCCDPSPDFVSFARNSVSDCHATFIVTDADNLPHLQGGFDVIVSGLVLNFLPQPLIAVRSMRERLRPGGTLAAYVWDYAQGMQFLRIFWDEAEAVDASAADLHEARRFPLCQPDRLTNLFNDGEFTGVATTTIQIDTVFPTFDDFWSPFLAGTGPAPSFVASLDPVVKDRLAQRLKQRLQPSGDGPIHLTARAFGVRGILPAHDWQGQATG
jgi:SAM-dependent methyltransferase